MATVNGMKLMKDTCSLTNALMANPRYTEPKVGMDVTQLMWSDRCAYRIIKVSKDKKTFMMQRYNAKLIGHYLDQNYQYEDENGNPLLHDNYTKTIKFRYGQWYEADHGWDGKVRYDKISLSFNCRDEYEDPSF